jgi:hypothetical protein
MFNNATVRAVIQPKWQEYGYKIFQRLFLWHLLDLSFMMAFIFLLSDHDFSDVGSTSTSPHREIALLVLLFGMSLLFIRNLYREIKQVYHVGSIVKYFSDPWNILDAASLSLFVAMAVLYLSGSESLRYVLGFGVYLKWFGVLYYLQAFDKTSALIRMIFQIVQDIRGILLVLSILILGVASAFYAILRQSGPGAQYGNAIKSLFSVFNMLLFSVYDLSDFGEEDTSTHVVKVIFAISMVLVSIVLLNLLIGK